MDRTKTALGALITGAFITGIGHAHAQEDDAEARTLDTVTVTAQKREQSALDVGISMSVIGEEAIRTRRLEMPADLIAFTPNSTMKENYPGVLPVITIRGVGLNDDFNATNNPSAGVYVDEVSLSSLALLSSDLFDLERIEVLKGPQGTLYGRNSTAGAVNILSAKPDPDDMTGRLVAGIDNFEGADLEAMANVPVTDTLAFRISGKGILQDEGFYFDENRGRDVGRREVLAGRVQAAWEATENLKLLLKVEGQRGRSELGYPEFFGVLPTATETDCPGSPECANFSGYTDTNGDPFRGAWSVDPDYNFDQVLTTLRVDADLGFADLTSVTGYVNFSRDLGPDTDASPFRLVDFRTEDDVNQISQEIRLSGSTPLLDWQAGVFYAVDNVEATYAGSFIDRLNTTTLTVADQSSTSQAIFGNAEWQLSDSVSLITGLRYTNEVREAENFTQDNVSELGGSGFTLAPFGSGPIVLASVDEEIDETSWSWKIGANWKPLDTVLIYASATQGTKSGGFFAGVATTDAQLQPYESETLIAYEAGIKGQAPEHGLLYEASVFFYDYSDVQTFIRDQLGAIPIQRLGNVDEAEIYGAELNLVYQPRMMDGLDLTAGIGVLETELGAFDSLNGAVPAGNEQPDAPDLTLNLGANYTAQVSDRLSVRLAVDGRYQSETYSDAINDSLLRADGYWVTNARLSVFEPGNWDLSLWGKNIGDEEYVTQGVNQSDFGYGHRIYGPPRTYGVSLTKHF
ncbi:MAG: TonB-dependent receptor [Pseudomonadota bacterium]